MIIIQSNIIKYILYVIQQVDNLRRQADEQELTLKVQEADLSSKKQELEELKTLEHKLEKDQAEMGKRLDELNSMLQNSQLQISQVKLIIKTILNMFFFNVISFISLRIKLINWKKISAKWKIQLSQQKKRWLKEMFMPFQILY